jgi:hypothetical protein
VPPVVILNTVPLLFAPPWWVVPNNIPPVDWNSPAQGLRPSVPLML